MTAPAPAPSALPRLRLAGLMLLPFAWFAVAVLAADTVFVATALWSQIHSPFLPDPDLLDYLYVGVPLAVQAGCYLVMVRSALRLWGPLAAGSELARWDAHPLAWVCAGGTAVSAVLAVVAGRASAEGAPEWLGALGAASLTGIAVLFCGSVAVAVATLPRR